ncbi:MAG: UDP-N-acetylmuramate--L-alanine ligase [Chloroflexi bacterium]|nr:UDP-N-acetylmuramate--L-alanine ligase [Chloroflexota bacterium]
MNYWVSSLSLISRNSYVTGGNGKRGELHFMGLGGIGMSGLARVMLEAGYPVSGCDQHPSAALDRLAAQGAKVFRGHNPSHLVNVERLVVSSAIPKDNLEITAARERGLPVFKRGEMLGQLMAGSRGIAVAGSHGKTTTTALIAYLLEQGGLDPTILVGGEMVDLGTNAKLGQGDYLVAEADEFDGSFLHLTPTIAVVTNIDAEHLDYYGNYQAVQEAFYRFMASTRDEGYLVVCGDDAGVRGLLPRFIERHLVTYGLGEGLDWQAGEIYLDAQGGARFNIYHWGRVVMSATLALNGRHNVVNSLAAAAVGSLLGLGKEKIRAALGSFQGVRRRFEVMGEVKGITVVEDYAHHPTEIRATLGAARTRFPGRRIRCLFQPHTYSRTKLLLTEFATSFQDAEEVVITDIYAAREDNTWGVSSGDVVAVMSHPCARYVADMHQAAEGIVGSARAGDVILVMGAGDIQKVSYRILEELSR